MRQSVLVAGPATVTAVTATIARVSPARAVAGPRRPRTGVEIAGDHDPDRLDPTGHVEHVAQAALGEDLVVLRARTLEPGRPVMAGILEPEKLEPLIVLIATSGDRCELVATPAGEAGGAAPLFPAPAASAAGTARLGAAGLGGRFAGVARSTLATAAPSPVA